MGKGYVKRHQTFYIVCVCRDREERLAALSAAQQEAMEELQKKIQMKATSFSFFVHINSAISF